MLQRRSAGFSIALIDINILQIPFFSRIEYRYCIGPIYIVPPSPENLPLMPLQTVGTRDGPSEAHELAIFQQWPRAWRRADRVSPNPLRTRAAAEAGHPRGLAQLAQRSAHGRRQSAERRCGGRQRARRHHRARAYGEEFHHYHLHRRGHPRPAAAACARTVHRARHDQRRGHPILHRIVRKVTETV